MKNLLFTILILMIFISESYCQNEQLHVEGNVKIVDGSEGDNKILSSDANGSSTWIGSPGISYFERTSAQMVSTSQFTTNLSAVDIDVPGPGFVVVSGSGTFFHPYTQSSQFLVRVKVSDIPDDVSEEPGIQFIRRTTFPANSGTNNYPFSINKVFTVNDAGTYTYYLNAWHQVVNGSVSLDDHTLIIQYFPLEY